MGGGGAQEYMRRERQIGTDAPIEIGKNRCTQRDRQTGTDAPREVDGQTGTGAPRETDKYGRMHKRERRTEKETNRLGQMHQERQSRRQGHKHRDGQPDRETQRKYKVRCTEIDVRQTGTDAPREMDGQTRTVEQRGKDGQTGRGAVRETD